MRLDAESHRGNSTCLLDSESKGPVKTMKDMLIRCARDQTGGEVLEYALIIGLLIIGALLLMGSVGTKIFQKWTSLDSLL